MSEHVSIGGELPELYAEGLGGETSLEALLEGRRGALLIFWSRDCSHCMRYDGYLGRLPERYPELSIVLIASRRQESREELVHALAERGLALELWSDREGRIASELGVQQTPTALLVDASRRLLYRGAIDNFRLEGDPEHVAYLEPALSAFAEGRAVERPQTASFGCPISSPYYEAR